MMTINMLIDLIIIIIMIIIIIIKKELNLVDDTA